MASFSQSEDRIKQIDEEINKAVSNEDYDLAAILKKEKSLRLETKEAVANSNFDLAASNKEKLNDIEKYLSLDELIAFAIDKEDYSKAKLLKSEKLELQNLINSDWKVVEAVPEEKIIETPITQKTEEVNTPKKAYVTAFSTNHFGLRGIGTPGYWAFNWSQQAPLTKGNGLILETNFSIGSYYLNSVIFGFQLGAGYKFETNYFSPYISTTFGYDIDLHNNDNSVNPHWGFASYLNIGSEIMTLPLGRTAFGFYFEANLHLFRRFSNTPDFLSLSLGFVIRNKKTNNKKYSYLTQ